MAQRGGHFLQHCSALHVGRTSRCMQMMLALVSYKLQIDLKKAATSSTREHPFTAG